MKGKILNARIDGKTTYVTKQTKYGTFTGKVTLNPEDEDVYSELDGYTFAEIKCDIQALKAKAKCMKQRAIGVAHAFNVLFKANCAAGRNAYSDDMLALARQVDVAWQNYYDAYEIYTINRDSYNIRVQRSLDYRRRIRNKTMVY